ncbi:MAG: PQQ-binding-like beta-propeller repeat protein [Aeoliella sp.]
MLVRPSVSLVATATVTTLLISAAQAGEWPTYRADDHRSGVTAEALAMPLSPQWTFRPQHGPRRAWPRTFRENSYTQTKIRSLLTFDHAFQAVAANGCVYFGSSADHKVTCLESETGEVRWDYFTEGPIRMAPTIAHGRVYVGSDDGFLYCLDADGGQLIFKHRVGPSGDRLPGNEQWISRWPIRSGVVVRDNVAYCAAGLFPHREGCFLCGVDAQTGKPLLTE